MSALDTCRSENGKVLVVGATVEGVRLPCRLAEVVRQSVRTARALGSFLAVAEAGTVLEKFVMSNSKNTELDLDLWTLAGGKRLCSCDPSLRVCGLKKGDFLCNHHVPHERKILGRPWTSVSVRPKAQWEGD